MVDFAIVIAYLVLITFNRKNTHFNFLIRILRRVSGKSKLFFQFFCLTT